MVDGLLDCLGRFTFVEIIIVEVRHQFCLH
jgi:hypothetical protein